MNSKTFFFLVILLLCYRVSSLVSSQEQRGTEEVEQDTEQEANSSSNESEEGNMENPAPEDVGALSEAESDETQHHESSGAEQMASNETSSLQSGPFVDLFGETLLTLEMLDETHAQLTPLYTNEALQGKKVVGVYFSADWCGPCRQFTPELTTFYEKMNSRRGRQGDFEIVWVSRCRDMNAYGQYFSQMGPMACPPARGGNGGSEGNL